MVHTLVLALGTEAIGSQSLQSETCLNNKNQNRGGQRRAQQMETLAALPENQGLPAAMWQLTTICNSSSRKSNAHFRFPQVPGTDGIQKNLSNMHKVLDPHSAPSKNTINFMYVVIKPIVSELRRQRH